MNDTTVPDQTPTTSGQVAAADQTPAVPVLSPALEQLLAADPMLTIEEVAAYLRVPVKTVRNWRTRQSRMAGPKAHTIGNHLRYRLSDVRAWFESQPLS